MADPRRLPDGPSDASRAAPRRLPLLENAVLLHLSVLVVGLSWAFGGQIPWARQALLGWGLVGVLLFIVGTALTRENGGPRIVWRHLWPLLLFDLIVVASCFNPSFKTVLRGAESYFQLTDPPFAWLPSSARPDLSLRELAEFNGIVLSCFNAFLCLQSRRRLRLLLSVVAVNALALAVFGTFQELVGAKGLWFGLVRSPQEYFFATFVYHNHWGAFTVLNTAACLGLFFHAVRRGGHRDFWHSPALAGAVAILLIAASVPLSGSRSSTMLMLLLLLVGFAHFLGRVIRKRRALHESVLPPVLALLLVAVLALGAVGFIGRKVISHRAGLTVTQLSHIRGEAGLNSRLIVYRDTWRMAMERPWFGWGLESYGDVFRIFNSQRTAERWVPYYREAHNDWFQSVAETGFVGTGLLVLLGVLPLAGVAWRRLESVIPPYLVGGCGLILLYAWVEFPFANPSVMVAFWCSVYVAARYARLDAGLSGDEKGSGHA